MCLRQFLNLNSLLNSSHSCMSLTTSHRGVGRTSKPALTLRDSRQSIVAEMGGGFSVFGSVVGLIQLEDAEGASIRARSATAETELIRFHRNPGFECSVTVLTGALAAGIL
jgi:hypothetical protein